MSSINTVYRKFAGVYVLTALLAFSLVHSSSLRADERWTVKGKITAEHVLPELKEAFGTSDGVGGVTVRVSARSNVLGFWGTWNSWGDIKTGPAGSFEVSETHNGDLRQFKVEILFDSDKLRIKEGQETYIKFDSHGFPLDVAFDLTDKDWHEVLNDSNRNGRKAGVIDLGDIKITRELVKKHADLWLLYNKAFGVFRGYGADYAFKNKVVVKYPMGIGDNASDSSSYSNPLNGVIYVKENQFTTGTLLHELMHQWTYERSTGEDAMVWQLAKHQSTHQPRENTTFVPFNEGFAEWASFKVFKEITDGKVLDSYSFFYKYPDLPLTRSYTGAALAASERSVANVDYTERGWQGLFNILTFQFRA